MKLSKDNTINLEDFRAKDGHKISKVFTGRDRGLYVREQSKIDEIEQSYDEVKIIIPNNIYSINPSFFEELFVNKVVPIDSNDSREFFEKNPFYIRRRL